MSEKKLNELIDSIIAENSAAEDTTPQSETTQGDDISAAVCEDSLMISQNGEMPDKRREGIKLTIRIIATLVAGYLLLFAGVIIFVLLCTVNVNMFLAFPCAAIPAALLIPLIWIDKKNKKGKLFTVWKIFAGISAVLAAVLIISVAVASYNDSIRVDTSPNINIWEYMPFDEKSKIVTLDDEASLKLEGDLPTVDGAAAVFPVYSAFVNETYPDTVRIHDGVFEYNNTVDGYILLAEKKTDIFFGAHPSDEQVDYAEWCGTTFEYTPIGTEAFVFFVHKNNPIDNLTTEQIQQIYAGEITNWAQVGGKDEPIAAYQRNEGSGSQSMLIRFMDGKEIMDPPTEMVNDLMSGIIEQVADYRSQSGSIGFSFRYYVEGIIKNPDIKLLSIDGVAPTVENIKNGSYPITTSLYAVTYEGNDNENVDKLLEWVLSEEGQEIIEETGYVGVAK